MVFPTSKNHHSIQRKDLHFLTSTTTVKNVGLSSALMTKPRRIDIFIIRSILHGFPTTKNHHFLSTERPTFFDQYDRSKKCRSVIHVDDKPRRIDILLFRSILHGFPPVKNHISFQQKDLHFLTGTTTVKNVGLSSVLMTNHVELISSSSCQFYMVFPTSKNHISFNRKTYIF
jgi:hypothetical protein